MKRAKRRPASLLLLLAFVSTSVVSAETVLYLDGTGVPEALLTPVAPVAASLSNQDPERDDSLGLLIARGGSGPSESDPTKYQQWTTSPAALTLDGPTSFEFWAAMKDFGGGTRGIVFAYLLDCDASGNNCVEIAGGSRDILDWSGAWPSWSRHAIGFGRITYSIPDGRSLALRVVIGSDSDDDMMLAYGAADFPSRLTDGAAYDTAIDCDFSDWSDGAGVEYIVNDQGGAGDWSSPSRLDVTVFAVSTNLVDSVHLLMGFDDAPVHGGTAATLFDTDLDNNADFALVANVDGADVSVDLYGCDDTLSDACGTALHRRSYASAAFCSATSAGPWNDDTLIEVALPFNDFDAEATLIGLTSLISYAASPLLTSAKDSIFGDFDQDYQAAIYYDITQGTSGFTPGIGSGFEVRRHTDPDSVRTSGIHATVSQAPFDDLPGTLGDGQTWYYVVEKQGGVPVSLSAHANTYDGVVRLGFADGDDLSAPVDSAASTVTAAVGTIPADGTSTAMVTVAPRDSHGQAIGTGSEISVDASALSPGALAGPVMDKGDGRYIVRVVSILPGTGDVVVTVEGISLNDSPSIVFTSP